MPLRHILLAAPLIFVAHFLEEGYAFVAWFNAHVARGISEPTFRAVNNTALGITLGIVAIEWLSKSRASAAFAVAWISLLMFANALFHIAGAAVDGAYMPGLATSILLYLPFWAWIVAHVVRTRRLSRAATAAAVAVGAMPMLAHGYLIVFRGSRLF